MSKINVKIEGHPLNRLWLWDESYSLGGSAFNEEIVIDINEKTGLEDGNLGDWFVFNNPDNPILTWEQLIMLSLRILNCDATKLFVHSLYLESIPELEFIKTDAKLPCQSVSGAKRINAFTDEEYTDHWNGTSPLDMLLTGNHPAPTKKPLGDNLFFLHGKDDSCQVEGTWLGWVMFACNIIASKNTEIICPDIYAEGMANDNY